MEESGRSDAWIIDSDEMTETLKSSISMVDVQVDIWTQTSWIRRIILSTPFDFRSNFNLTNSISEVYYLNTQNKNILPESRKKPDWCDRFMFWGIVLCSYIYGRFRHGTIKVTNSTIYFWSAYMEGFLNM